MDINDKSSNQNSAGRAGMIRSRGTNIDFNAGAFQEAQRQQRTNRRANRRAQLSTSANENITSSSNPNRGVDHQANSDQNTRDQSAGAENKSDQKPQGENKPSLREAVQTEKRKQGQIAIATAKKDSPITPMRRATSKLLKNAWLHLADSWGFTLIWINIHVFLGTIFGDKFFCKLGAEWLDGSIQIANMEAAKKLGSKGKIAEGAGLACCDLGCLLLIISLAATVAMVVGFIENPFRAIAEILKDTFSNWQEPVIK